MYKADQLKNAWIQNGACTQDFGNYCIFRASKAQTILHICADLPEHSLLETTMVIDKDLMHNTAGIVGICVNGGLAYLR